MVGHERYQVTRPLRDVVDTATPKVSASPVDSYIRPTANTVQLDSPDDSLAGLADALKVTKPLVSEIGADLIKQSNEEQTKQGQAARIKNQKDFRAAVAEGLIPEAANPWFVKGYMQMDGRASGQSMDAELRQAWAQSNVKESDDPNKFKEFVSGFVKDWVSKNDGGTQDWMDGFKPEMSKSENNLFAQHIAHRQAEISAGMREKAGQVVSTLLANQAERERDMNPNDPIVQASRESLKAEINTLGQSLVAKGLPGTDFNKIVAETVITRDQELGGALNARAILSGIKTPGGTVADIADVKKNLYASEVAIRREKAWERNEQWSLEDRPAAVAHRDFSLEQIKNTRDQWKTQQESHDIELQSRGYTDEMVFEMMSGKGLDKVKLLKLAGIDGVAAVRMQNFFRERQIQSQEIITDKGVYQQMLLKVYRDPSKITAEDVFSLMRPGGLDAPAAQHIWSEAQRLQKEFPEEHDPFFRNQMEILIKSVSINKEGAQTGSSIADAGTAAMIFRNAWNESKNLPASERQQKAEELRYKLLERYNKTAFELTKTGAAETLAVAEKADRTYINPRTNEKAIIPESHIQKLLLNPDRTKDFDKAYGVGSAKRLLDAAGIKIPPVNKPKPPDLPVVDGPQLQK